MGKFASHPGKKHISATFTAISSFTHRVFQLHSLAASALDGTGGRKEERKKESWPELQVGGLPRDYATTRRSYFMMDELTSEKRLMLDFCNNLTLQ